MIADNLSKAGLELGLRVVTQQLLLHFSSSVALFHIPDRFGDIAQLVSPVDDWFHSS
jgi:hypothetical protein